ncbi:FRG domain-containing protein [Bacillus halotolerans]|uniref:FRG domain-containing protein n=1 Tax=Bacillus halotolerans TaxID=260554 RepID=UPI002DBF243B|nr:FRG domain-containing protein [Bacillus halotolerans]MEC0251764.1 FRG domain-containing protein [Bacillus halotolerans]MEC0359000.1 FRG domain-containing protein [Bacillus halotolerans]
MFSKKWIELLNEVQDFQEKTIANKIWFRGQNNASYPLNSGLYRVPLKDKMDYLKLERSAYTFYLRSGATLHNADNWELLFIMQHHGVRTRLLDWSESFTVALYFACLDWKHDQNDCVVWLLDPIKLNIHSAGKDMLFAPGKSVNDYLDFINFNEPEIFDTSVALYPVKNNPRIIAQQGVFTMQGINNMPLEKEFDGELFNLNVLKKIRITKDLKEDAFKYLKLNGLSHNSLFPDLDGLAMDTNEMIEEKQKKIIDSYLIEA